MTATWVQEREGRDERATERRERLGERGER